MQVEEIIEKVVNFARVQLIQKIKDGVAKVTNKIMDKVYTVPAFSLHVIT